MYSLLALNGFAICCCVDPLMASDSSGFPKVDPDLLSKLEAIKGQHSSIKQTHLRLIKNTFGFPSYELLVASERHGEG